MKANRARSAAIAETEENNDVSGAKIARADSRITRSTSFGEASESMDW
jgi:hypothetical protein